MAAGVLLAALILPAQSKRTEDLAVGKLLVTPRDAPDPAFAESVILLVHYDSESAVGLMINRRTALTQVLALLTMENGVMLAAIALTTYGMPLIVEIGVFFDVVIAVMVLAILVFRIRETFSSMDVSKLNQLKW